MRNSLNTGHLKKKTCKCTLPMARTKNPFNGNKQCKCVTIHGETPRDWSWLGAGHKNDILTTDDSYSFRLKKNKLKRLGKFV